MAKHTPATAAQVRAWAVEQGLIAPDAQKKGRLSPEVRAAFNAGKPKGAQYVEGHKAPRVVEVKVATQDAKGRKRTRVVKVDPTAARQYAQANGSTAKRGRLSQATLSAFALSTLS